MRIGKIQLQHCLISAHVKEATGSMYSSFRATADTITQLTWGQKVGHVRGYQNACHLSYQTSQSAAHRDRAHSTTSYSELPGKHEKKGVSRSPEYPRVAPGNS